jgi:uncharacterized lipoprotein YehR (DUF1307 family)
MKLLSKRHPDKPIIFKAPQRAERRVFYIDVGTFPKESVQKYLDTIKAEMKNIRGAQV